ncbi:MAG TPA: dienelactone hydrolase family protein [Pirellulales bacterium]|jgi:carboxymethylenebutenolidase
MLAGSIMWRCYVFLAIVTLAVQLPVTSARAGEDGAPQRRAEWVQIASPAGRSLKTYVVRPVDVAPTRAVVIVHENRGLTTWELEIADRLADAGHLAIAPDMLSESGPDRGGSASFDSTAAARDAIHGLQSDAILVDLDAVVEYANTIRVATDGVVVVGFCWGGGQVFRYAAHNTQLAAAVVFYGPAPNEELLKQVSAPVYGFYGEQDVPISADVPKIKSRMKTFAKNYQPEVFAGARHGFMRSGALPDAGPADRKAHDEAWVRFAQLLAAP